MANKPTTTTTSTAGQPGRPSGSPNTSASIKIAQIARWKVAGVSYVVMAEMLNMTTQGIQAITKTKEYIEYESAILNGHLSAMDQALAGRVSAIRKEMQVAVPAALRCLVDAVTQRRDLPTALSAAKEIFKLDPERTFVEQKQENAAPGLPAEVLDAAAAEGNKISDSLNKDAKKETVN